MLKITRKAAQRKMHAHWLKIVLELTQAVDIIMARAKRIYILIIKVPSCFPFFPHIVL